MTPFLHLGSEVRDALVEGRPVVALESTVIAHGLPYPVNLETASAMEEIVRQNGATPATVAILGGKIRVGLSADELHFLATGTGIRKTSRRDLALVTSRGQDGATTVAATATIAAWAGIWVFATGGIGGVHRGRTFDISNDLPTLASVPVAVVCSGGKSILDLPATLEWLETAGVPVVGYGTDEFPAFYSRSSGLRVDTRLDRPEEVASVIRAGRVLGLGHGILVTVPVPAEAELSREYVDEAIATAIAEAEAQQIGGNAYTPFLLRHVARLTEGASLTANVSLLKNNALVAAQISAALGKNA